mgnify:CR=1 FL=1
MTSLEEIIAKVVPPEERSGFTRYIHMTPGVAMALRAAAKTNPKAAVAMLQQLYRRYEAGRLPARPLAGEEAAPPISRAGTRARRRRARAFYYLLIVARP